MSQNDTDRNRESVLEAKKAANASNGSNPALTPSEVQELNTLQSEAK